MFKKVGLFYNTTFRKVGFFQVTKKSLDYAAAMGLLSAKEIERQCGYYLEDAKEKISYNKKGGS